MTTALIVAGVVVFLLVDGFILLKVLKRHRTAGDLASLSVPGETTLALPPGKVKLTYNESVRSSSSDDDIHFATPPGFSVEVRSPSGAPLEIKGPGFRGMGESVSTGPGFSRTLVGTVEVTEPGPHTVTANADVTQATDPKLLIGR